LISFSLQFTVWKEKQLGKLSTNQKPDESSLWKLLKEEKRLLRWLLEFTMELLSFCHCLEVKFSKDNQWGFIFFKYWFFRKELRAWFVSKDTILNCCFLLILLRWRCMGMRSAIASISHMGKIWKAWVIYIAALHCIFFNSSREWNKDVVTTTSQND